MEGVVAIETNLLFLANMDRMYIEQIRDFLQKEKISLTIGDPDRVSESDLIEQAQGHTAVIAGSEFWSRRVLERVSNSIGIIIRCGTGYDGVDIRAALEHGILVANTPGMNLNAVAEMALAFLLALQRRLKDYDRDMRAGKWTPLPARELSGKTIGLIGFGGIARRFARLLCGFGCELIAFDPYPDEAAAKQVGVQLTTWEKVLKNSDAISLHLPLNEQTRGIIDQAAFASMKNGVILINTSRGAVINEDALLQALRDGKVAGAGLDVHTTEPAPSNYRLLTCDNVLLSPHCSSSTEEAYSKMLTACVRQAAQFYRGEKVDNLVGI